MSELRIRADELIMALENHSYEMQFYLDRRTGDVFPVVVDNEESDEDRERIEAEPDRFMPIDAVPSSVAWEVMAAFVEALAPGRPRSDLARAINARHPFRAFKDELSRLPRLREEWFAFHDREWLRLAGEWLDEAQIAATLVGRQEWPVSGAPGDSEEGGPGAI